MWSRNEISVMLHWSNHQIGTEYIKVMKKTDNNAEFRHQIGRYLCSNSDSIWAKVFGFFFCILETIFVFCVHCTACIHTPAHKIHIHIQIKPIKQIKNSSQIFTLWIDSGRYCCSQRLSSIPSESRKLKETVD